VTATKHCSKCKTTKLLGDFGKHSGSSDGLQPWCKECNNAASREHGRRNSARVHVDIPATKLCVRCQTVKPQQAFGRAYARTSALQSYCKECKIEYQRQRAAGK
jgi:hypothetical protein